MYCQRIRHGPLLWVTLVKIQLSVQHCVRDKNASCCFISIPSGNISLSKHFETNMFSTSRVVQPRRRICGVKTVKISDLPMPISKSCQTADRLAHVSGHVKPFTLLLNWWFRLISRPSACMFSGKRNKPCKIQNSGIKATHHCRESTSFNFLLNSSRTFPEQWNPLPSLHSLLWLPLHF
jgi:hypothetical protein